MDVTKTSYKSRQLAASDLSTFVSTWLSDHELQFSQATHRTYEKSIKIFVDYRQKRQKPAIDALLVKQYVRDLKWRRCSPAYIQKQLSVLRSFCAWAVDQNLLPFNPAIKIPLPKLANHEYRWEHLKKEEAVRLLASIPGNSLAGLRDYALVSAILYSGVRLTELHRANVEDYVPSANNPGGAEGVLYVQGKGRETTDNLVVIVPEAAEALVRYLRARGTPQPGEPLFCSLKRDRQGKRLSVRGIQAVISAHLKEARVKRKRVVPYSLRHTAATNALENGATTEDVQLMLRHASIATTQRYVHMVRRIQDGAERHIRYAKNRIDMGTGECSRSAR